LIIHVIPVVTVRAVATPGDAIACRLREVGHKTSRASPLDFAPYNQSTDHARDRFQILGKNTIGIMYFASVDLRDRISSPIYIVVLISLNQYVMSDRWSLVGVVARTATRRSGAPKTPSNVLDFRVTSSGSRSMPSCPQYAHQSNAPK